jgi:hypothetical protein
MEKVKQKIQLEFRPSIVLTALAHVVELKMQNYDEKCYPSTYQSRTISELLDKVGED